MPTRTHTRTHVFVYALKDAPQQSRPIIMKNPPPVANLVEYFWTLSEKQPKQAIKE